MPFYMIVFFMKVTVFVMGTMLEDDIMMGFASIGSKAMHEV